MAGSAPAPDSRSQWAPVEKLPLELALFYYPKIESGRLDPLIGFFVRLRHGPTGIRLRAGPEPRAVVAHVEGDDRAPRCPRVLNLDLKLPNTRASPRPLHLLDHDGCCSPGSVAAGHASDWEPRRTAAAIVAWRARASRSGVKFTHMH